MQLAPPLPTVIPAVTMVYARPPISLAMLALLAITTLLTPSVVSQDVTTETAPLTYIGAVTATSGGVRGMGRSTHSVTDPTGRFLAVVDTETDRLSLFDMGDTHGSFPSAGVGQLSKDVDGNAIGSTRFMLSVSSVDQEEFIGAGRPALGYNGVDAGSSVLWVHVPVSGSLGVFQIRIALPEPGSTVNELDAESVQYYFAEAPTFELGVNNTVTAEPYAVHAVGSREDGSNYGSYLSIDDLYDEKNGSKYSLPRARAPIQQQGSHGRLVH